MKRPNDKLDRSIPRSRLMRRDNKCNVRCNEAKEVVLLSTADSGSGSGGGCGLVAVWPVPVSVQYIAAMPIERIVSYRPASGGSEISFTAPSSATSTTSAPIYYVEIILASADPITIYTHTAEL